MLDTMGRKIRIRKMGKPIEKKIAMGLIVSSRFIRDIQPIYKSSYIDIPYVRTLAKWCFKYYKRYGKSPKKHIQDIYQRNRRKGLIKDEQADLMGEFLHNLSKKYESKKRINVDLYLDQVEEYFAEKSMEALKEDITGEMALGNRLEAEAIIARYRAPSRPQSTGINPFTNPKAMRQAFETQGESLFTLPGPLGYLLNTHLVREGFIGLMGPEKRGKSFWLQELAKRAIRAENNVAFFGAGDMSENEYTIRWAVSLSGRSNLERYCGRLKVPVLDCARNQDDSCHKKERASPCGLEEGNGNEDEDDRGVSDEYKACTWCAKRSYGRFKSAVHYEIREKVSPLEWKEAYKACRPIRKRMRSRDFKLVCYPNDTLSVNGIESQLDIWESNEGFTPDIIFVDYADILAPDPGIKDTREQQNKIWKQLRSLSQKKHCLVVTATQTDAKSYDAALLRMGHFSEDKRKYAHVTGMIGLNQTEEEKEEGIMRINWVVLRGGEYKVSNVVNVLQCLQIGKPLISSYWEEKRDV